MDEQAAIQAIEGVVETLIPEAVEVVTVIKNNPLILAGVAIVSLAAGGFVGYKVTKGKLETKYSAIADDEIQEAKIFYATLNKTNYSTPGEAVQALIPGDEQVVQVMRDYNGISKKKAVELVIQTPPAVSNIFVNNKPLSEVDFDYDAEAPSRASGNPYVITFDEYFQNEGDYTSVSMTYFVVDGVLLDENEEQVEDVDTVVGETNLERFGHGSKDNNVVYIQNDEKQMVFEIVRSLGSYVEEVLGIVEPARSAPKVRKFRGDDD